MKRSRAMWWLKQEGKVYWFVAFIAIVVMVSLGYAGHKHKSTKGASEYIGVVLDSAVVPMSNYKVDANVHVYGYSIIEGCEYIGVVLDSAVVPMSNYKVDANVH